MKLLLGPWLPDLPDHAADGLITISNAYPGPNGYRPVGQYMPSQAALASKCKGASSFTSPAGVSVTIAGTADSLYKSVAGAWVLLGAGYNVQPDERWRFVQFGGLAIATNQTDPLVKINLDTGVTATLGGSPPKIQMLAVVNNFLVGGVVDGDTSRVCWSGENDAEYWTFGSKKSDYNIEPDGGAITGIVGGEFGLILQKNCIRRMSYVGGNVLFRIDKIQSGVGCSTVHSVIQYGDIAFWYASDGFKMWDGSAIQPIGFEQVDDTFAKTYTSADFTKMSSAIDGANNVACWSMGDKQWLYNWRLQKWSIIDFPAEIVFNGVSETITLDARDNAVGVVDDNVDGAGLVSFDDIRFQGGDPRFFVFGTDHTMGVFSGPNMSASFGMRNAEITEGFDTRVRRARFMSDVTGGLTLTLNVKQRLGDPGISKVSTALSSTGEMNVRARGRYVKAKIDVAVGQPWTFMQGADFKGSKGAAR